MDWGLSQTGLRESSVDGGPAVVTWAAHAHDDPQHRHGATITSAVIVIP